MRVLLVEDEPEMAEALGSALRRHDMIVDQVGSFAIAAEALRSKVHAVVLIDRQLPDGDGIGLVSLIREEGLDVPSIVISALGTTSHRIEGLDVGADDYLPKPFAVDELLARIRAVLRRPGQSSAQVINLASLHYHIASREFAVSDVSLVLTRRELLILERLVRRPGRVVPKESLEEAAYTFDDEIQSNSLEANISRLRRKLADAKSGVEIRNIRGVGYIARATTE